MCYMQLETCVYARKKQLKVMGTGKFMGINLNPMAETRNFIYNAHE
jgi:hypothetical protein